MSISDCTECWYVPGSRHIVDVIRPDTGRTHFSGRSADDVQRGNPGAQRMSLDEAVKLVEVAEAKRYVKPVSEITRADYWYALEVLPPADWKRRKGVESFKMSERTCGMITQIFAQCGERYFTLSDQCTVTADEIADRVGAYIAEHPVAAPQQHFSL